MHICGFLRVLERLVDQGLANNTSLRKEHEPLESTKKIDSAQAQLSDEVRKGLPTEA